MRKLFLTTALIALVGASPSLARGRHHPAHHHATHAHDTVGQSASAGQKKADTRTPEKRDPEDSKIDRKIKSICRGC